MEGKNRAPAGPPRSAQRHSPAVYRRRRLVAFLICGLVLIGVVKVFSSLTGSGSSDSHTETSTAQAGRAGSVPTPTPAASATADPNASSARAAADLTPCSLAALSVRAGIPSYQLRKPFVLPVTVQLANRLGQACRLDTSRLTVVVQNGTAQAWASQGCPVAGTATGTPTGTPTAVPSGASNGAPTAVPSGTASGVSTGSDAGSSLLVPAGATVDWTVRWPATACSGPLRNGQYDISAWLDGGVQSGWAGTVTVS